jgi:hypothetical protein
MQSQPPVGKTLTAEQREQQQRGLSTVANQKRECACVGGQERLLLSAYV